MARVEALAGWQEEPGKLDDLAAGTLTPVEDGEGVWTGILTQAPSPSGSLVWRVRAYDAAGNLLYEDCSNPERFLSLKKEKPVPEGSVPSGTGFFTCG